MSVISWRAEPGREEGVTGSCGSATDESEAGVVVTSLVMQPSLLRSYRLKAQFSLSVMEPLRMMDRLMTKSCSRTRDQKKPHLVL